MVLPLSVWSDGWKWKAGQIFCQQDYSLESYKLQHSDGKLEALAVEISPVSAESQLLFAPQSSFQKSYLVIFCQGFSVKFGDLDWR